MNALEIDSFFDGVNDLTSLNIKFEEPSFYSLFRINECGSDGVIKGLLKKQAVWLNLNATNTDLYGGKTRTTGVKISMTKIGSDYHVLEYHYNNKNETASNDNSIASNTIVHNIYDEDIEAAKAIYNSLFKHKDEIYLGKYLEFTNN